MDIIIIGSGIGGMACAATLAKSGQKIKILEQNNHVGGKAGKIKVNGYEFDTGPSLLTYPNWFDDLFLSCGKNPRDYFNYIRLENVTRYFFDEGKFVDVVSDLEETAENFEKKLGIDKNEFLKYFKKWEDIYKISEEVFLKGEFKIDYKFIKNSIKWISKSGISNIFKSMATYNKRLQNPALEKIMNRFATYTGSSPFETPAFMNQLAVVEMVLGGFYPNGGIFNLPKALEKLCLDLGVEFEFNCKIEKIEALKNNFKLLSSKQEYNATKLISNIDYFTTQDLLGNTNKIFQSALSTSCIVFYWGVKANFDKLKLHNIIFSEDYKKEFTEIFQDKVIPNDPTIYINISSKMDSDHAPEGCENWFVMINIPAQSNHISDDQIKRVKKLIIKNVFNKFKVDINNLIEFEEVLTPKKLFENTGSYLGALYGNHQNSIYSIMKRKKNQDQKMKNLFYVGGTVHPGGGMPLALRSGVNTANKILNETL